MPKSFFTLTQHFAMYSLPYVYIESPIQLCLRPHVKQRSSKLLLPRRFSEMTALMTGTLLGVGVAILAGRLRRLSN